MFNFKNLIFFRKNCGTLYLLIIIYIIITGIYLMFAIVYNYLRQKNLNTKKKKYRKKKLRRFSFDKEEDINKQE